MNNELAEKLAKVLITALKFIFNDCVTWAIYYEKGELTLLLKDMDNESLNIRNMTVSDFKPNLIYLFTHPNLRGNYRGKIE